MMWRFPSAWAFLLSLIIAPICAAQLPPYPPQLLDKHLVDIGGGRRMNIVCIGTGSPTLVFEYGLGGDMLVWEKVEAPAAAMTRACFTDRAGYGFSDPSPAPMTADSAADDLHALLQHAGISGPLVLVGHSLGGLFATLYADKFPTQVAGLVLIDPSFAGQRPKNRSNADRLGAKAEFDAFVSRQRDCAALARAGRLTQADPHGCFQLAPGRTQAETDYLLQQFLKPTRYESTISEAENNAPLGPEDSEDGQEEARATRSFGDMPLVVLTAGLEDPDPNTSANDQTLFAENWKAGHDRLAARSSRGESIVVAQAHHAIQLGDPQAVIDAIRKVVAQVRGEAIRK